MIYQECRDFISKTDGIRITLNTETWLCFTLEDSMGYNVHVQMKFDDETLLCSITETLMHYAKTAEKKRNRPNASSQF